MTVLRLDEATTLPTDGYAGALAGRVWRPELDGPSVVALRADGVYDVTGSFATIRDLCESADPAAALRAASGARIGALEEVLANTPPDSRDPAKPWLLAPLDLQAIKAAGVTFATSMLERVIEERARGDRSAAERLRADMTRLIGADLATLRPGSPEAQTLKEALIAEGAWSQYLEVGIGPDAEIFTKAQPMSAIGAGADAGFHSASLWNNPEPEAVLLIASSGAIIGATLGNDVNLRDFEGRSALLLSKAKDNTASCAIGPFIRLFDADFGIDDVRQAQVELVIEGTDNFRLEGVNRMAEISRDPLELVRQTLSEHHYPDGFVLFCGTLFAPTQDRDVPGGGFTHKIGDKVTIRSERLGALTNTVTTSREAPAWTQGIGEFIRNLAARGLIACV